MNNLSLNGGKGGEGDDGINSNGLISVDGCVELNGELKLNLSSIDLHSLQNGDDDDDNEWTLQLMTFNCSNGEFSNISTFGFNNNDECLSANPTLFTSASSLSLTFQIQHDCSSSSTSSSGLFHILNLM